MYSAFSRGYTSNFHLKISRGPFCRYPHFRYLLIKRRDRFCQLQLDGTYFNEFGKSVFLDGKAQKFLISYIFQMRTQTLFQDLPFFTDTAPDASLAAEAIPKRPGDSTLDILGCWVHVKRHLRFLNGDLRVPPQLHPTKK